MADTPSDPAQNPEPEQTKQTSPTPPPQQAPIPAVPAFSRRAFQGLKIELTDAELANPGTQKCILDMLYQAEEERNDLREFRKKYFEEAAKVEVADEKLKTSKVNEVMFGAGVGVGCAIIGLAPWLWGMTPDGHLAGGIALVLGGLLTIGASVCRIIFK